MLRNMYPASNKLLMNHGVITCYNYKWGDNGGKIGNGNGVNITIIIPKRPWRPFFSQIRCFFFHGEMLWNISSFQFGSVSKNGVYDPNKNFSIFSDDVIISVDYWTSDRHKRELQSWTDRLCQSCAGHPFIALPVARLQTDQTLTRTWQFSMGVCHGLRDQCRRDSLSITRVLGISRFSCDFFSEIHRPIMSQQRKKQGICRVIAGLTQTWSRSCGSVLLIRCCSVWTCVSRQMGVSQNGGGLPSHHGWISPCSSDQRQLGSHFS